MISKYTKWSILISLDAGNLVFLTVCCYLLIQKYRRKLTKDPQEIYLINLAASEILASFFLLARDAVLIQRLFDVQNIKFLERVFWCLNIAYVSGVAYITIFARFFVTGDRMLHILLSIRYEQYWNVKKTWKLITITWIGNILLSITLAVSMHYHYEYFKKNIRKIISVYILTILYVAFLVFVIVAYTLMFMRHARPRVNSTSLKTKRSSLFTIFFVRSRFFISLVLVVVYLTCTVIPSLTRLMYYIAATSDVPAVLTYLYLVSTRLSYTVDGIIYTIMQREVRELLHQMLCKKRKSMAMNLTNSVQTIYE